jgi:translation initiation factor 2 gamma subunit (eIF-2gamma)
MFGLSKIQLGIMVALFLAVLAEGWLLKESYKQNGLLEAANEVNVRKVEEALAEVKKVEDLRREDQAKILALSVATTEMAKQVGEERARLDKHRSTLLDRTLAKPKVTEIAARRAIRAQMCERWRITGGKGECPK